LPLVGLSTGRLMSGDDEAGERVESFRSFVAATQKRLWLPLWRRRR